MSELKKLRTKIDVIDRRIVGLLNRRLATVAKIGEWKATRKLASYSPSRSAEIMRNVQKANKGPHDTEQLTAIYQKIIAASVTLQDRQTKTMGAASPSASTKAVRPKAAPSPKPKLAEQRKK